MKRLLIGRRGHFLFSALRIIQSAAHEAISLSNPQVHPPTSGFLCEDCFFSEWNTQKIVLLHRTAHLFLTLFVKSSFRLTVLGSEIFSMYPLLSNMHSHLPRSGTFLTTDEPIVTCGYHPMSTVYILVHSWCCPGQMYNDTYPSL